MKKCLILVASAAGQPGYGAFARQAANGERPRKDYVELARTLDADVIDSEYMASRATPLARFIARYHFPIGQVVEAFLRRGRYRQIIAWSDRLGLPLALLMKLTRSHHRLVLLAQWLSPAKKAVFLRNFRVDSHIRAIALSGERQTAFARHDLGVSPAKLHRYALPVDERFWSPVDVPAERLICSAGVEGRDYATLVEAARGLDVDVELGIASTSITGAAAARRSGLDPDSLPPNVRISSPTLHELRDLYARSRFVVIPLKDADWDTGSTVATESMAMGKAVIMTRTRGHAAIVQHGETGLSVPPGDVAALRTAITMLLDDDARTAEMGRAARRRIEACHSMDAFVAQLAGLGDESAPEGHVAPVSTAAYDSPR